MLFHLHADLPYCGLKRLNSESRCWFAQYPAPFPICVARVRSSFIHNNLPVMRTNECSYPSLVRFCTREELRQTSFLRKLAHCSSNKLRNSLQCITRHPRNVPRDHDSKVQITHLKKCMTRRFIYDNRQRIPYIITIPLKYYQKKMGARFPRSGTAIFFGLSHDWIFT